MSEKVNKQIRIVDAFEHNHDIIRSSDRIIDLGPEGGDEGGIVH